MNTFFQKAAANPPGELGRPVATPIPSIGEQESSSTGNIHHRELQNELKNFK